MTVIKADPFNSSAPNVENNTISNEETIIPAASGTDSCGGLHNSSTNVASSSRSSAVLSSNSSLPFFSSHPHGNVAPACTMSGTSTTDYDVRRISSSKRPLSLLPPPSPSPSPLPPENENHVEDKCETTREKNDHECHNGTALIPPADHPGPCDHSNHPRGEEEQQHQDHEKVSNKMDTKSSSAVALLEEDPILEEWKAKGSRGDPRMHRAVAARLANPELSLFQALVAGGFKFPNYKETKRKKKTGQPQASVYDSDKILLSQRKNQLSRRLRLHTRKTRATKGQKHHVNIPGMMDSVYGIQNHTALNTILGASNTFNFSQHQQKNERGYQASFPPQPKASEVLIGHPGDTSKSDARLFGLMNAHPQQQQYNLLLNSQNNHHGGYYYQSPPFPSMSGMVLGDNHHRATLQLNLTNLQQRGQHNLALHSLSCPSPSYINHPQPGRATFLQTTRNHGGFRNRSNMSPQTEPMVSSLPIVQNHLSHCPLPMNPPVTMICDVRSQNKAGYAEHLRLQQQATVLRQKAGIGEFKSENFCPNKPIYNR